MANDFTVDGLKNVKCSECGETKTCLYVTFSGQWENGRITICTDCIQKEIDKAY